ncbi:MAG TPA: beta-ketoacyl-ACP synthase I, partial [Oceanicaulis sp.]|nr:beta-ketoacyl-ACP synthase I [Oceanicaulis sp.]
MRRVVVTGIGIVSSIGDNAAEVAASLKAGKSGVIAAPEYADLNFKCQVHARPNANPAEHVDKRAYRFMGEGA